MKSLFSCLPSTFFSSISERSTVAVVRFAETFPGTYFTISISRSFFLAGSMWTISTCLETLPGRTSNISMSQELTVSPFLTFLKTRNSLLHSCLTDTSFGLSLLTHMELPSHCTQLDENFLFNAMATTTVLAEISSTLIERFCHLYLYKG